MMDGPISTLLRDGTPRLDSGAMWLLCPLLEVQCGVAALLGKLYAVGGRDGSSCLKSVECFDPHTNKWTHCQPMSKRRGGVGAANCNGFLYAVGGYEAPATNPACSRFDCAER
ncbi:Kelch-like protein 18 [Bulinus truncatus]|nr:Kelch-like protein 18 [Bulinus truncatus]